MNVAGDECIAVGRALPVVGGFVFPETALFVVLEIVCTNEAFAAFVADMSLMPVVYFAVASEVLIVREAGTTMETVVFLRAVVSPLAWCWLLGWGCVIRFGCVPLWGYFLRRDGVFGRDCVSHCDGLIDV